MDQIDEILEKYEGDLKRADEGKCKKVVQCVSFKKTFQKRYKEEYRPRLEKTREKLIEKKHAVKIEERSSEEIFYGFTLSVVPRHLLRCPIDRHYPSTLWSSISFVANEHTLTVDVETAVKPNIEREESNSIEKIPKDQFNEGLLMKKVAGFLQRVFDETIVLDFKGLYDSLTGSLLP